MRITEVAVFDYHSHQIIRPNDIFFKSHHWYEVPWERACKTASLATIPPFPESHP